MKKQLIYLFACIAIIFATASFTAAIMADRTAKVEMYQGYYVFYKSMPTDEYEYLGVVHTPSIVKNFRAATLLDAMVRKCKEEYPKANALIVKDEDFANSEAVVLK